MKLLILTPTLGRSPYIARTCESICRLDVDVLHVCVGPFLELPGHKRVERIWLADVGGGMYAALNQGLKYALMRSDWKWFTYLNDDDELEIADVAVLSLLSGCVYGKGTAIGVNSEILFRIPVSRTPKDIFTLAIAGVVGLTQQGLFIERSAIEQVGFFDADLRYAGDLEYILRLLSQRVPFHYVHEINGFFRITPSQLSKNTERMSAERAKVIAKHKVHVGWAQKILVKSRFRVQNYDLYLARLRKFGFRSVKNIYES